MTIAKVNWRNSLLVSFCLLICFRPDVPAAQETAEDEQVVDSVQFQASDSLQLKSESRAFNWSLLGTLVPLPTLVLAFPGIIVGPSLGYFYGGMPGRAWTGIGLRTAALGGIIIGLLICWNCGPEASYTTNWIVLVSSAGLLVGSAVYDIASIKKAIRNKNASIQNSVLTLTPRYFVRTKSVGLALSFRM